ncbi:MAG: thiamine phosphate synthase [Deltaproteobacteria bacterium]|nr:MAG: thiamine phosphate synthase [Deltaproteobacteria bacterium]
MTGAAGRAAPARLRGLHVLADDDPRWGRDPVAQARAACAGGAAVVQLRCKHATDRAALDLAATIRELTHSSGALFFVNDRFDLALLAGADGVHLGQEDLPPARVPAAARARLLIGRSTHTRDQARRACREPVDYLAFGPIFGTRSKDSKHAPRGVERLRDVARIASPRPLVAIGGVDARSASALVAAGAAGVAVISAVAAAPDMVAATRALVAALRSERAA